MAKVSIGPWYWREKDGWFVHAFGKRNNLKVKGEGAEAEAVRAWHRLMADGLSIKAVVVAAKPTVKDVVTAYLADAERRVKAQTMASYRPTLQAVVEVHGRELADAFTQANALAWANRPGWSSSTRYGVLGTLQTAFKWAEANGLIASSPLKRLKRPPKQSRGVKSVVTADSHAVLMAAASPTLRPVLALLHATGARPSEVCRLTAKDVGVANGVAVLSDHKTSAHGHSRFIVLTPSALAILQPLIAAGKAGPLLRNAKGNPWSKDALGHAMRRLSLKCGVKAIAYGFRHTFATDALASGVPDATVAALLGHSGTTMLHKHYSHLTHQATTMKQAALQVRG